MLSGQNQNLYSALLVEQNSFFDPFVSWSNNVMFANTDFGISQSPHIGLHRPTSLALGRGNLAMCHCEARQSVFKTDVVWATPCSIEFKDSSMHASIVARLLGIEQFTFFVRCKSQWAPCGKFSLCLVDPNTSKPSKAQSLVLRTYAPKKHFIASTRILGSPHLTTTFSFKDVESWSLPIDLPFNHTCNLEFAWMQGTNHWLSLHTSKSSCCWIVTTTCCVLSLHGYMSASPHVHLLSYLANNIQMLYISYIYKTK